MERVGLATAKLGEMLVSRGLITSQQLSDALLAQHQFGGRLGENLIEMGLVTDDAIAATLSEQLGVPYAGPQMLASLSREVIALLPVDLARRYRAVPLRLQNGELHVCLADPHNFGQLDELSFALNRRLRPYVVTEVTLDYALERYYKIQRERRMRPSSMASVGWPDMSAQASVGGLTPLPSLGTRDQDPLRGDTVVQQLAAVTSETDLESALFRYLTEMFDEVVMLAIRTTGLALVRAGTPHRPRATSGFPTISLAAGTLLGNLVARPQVTFQRTLTDPEAGVMCRNLGLPLANVTLISLFSGEIPCYAIIAWGRDEAYLRRVFPGLKTIIGKAAVAIQMLALRRQILES